MARTSTNLVNQAFNLFRIQKLINQVVPEKATFMNPFITVAREPGSGGAPIAKAVAEKLGFEFVDKQILEAIAKSTHKRTAIIKEIDEKSRNRVEDIIHSVLNLEYVDDAKYITELGRVVASYASKGNVVILGRGSHLLTPMAKGLHVSVTAPKHVRIRRAMEYEGFDQQKARQVIGDVEESRNKFIKQYFTSDAKRRNVYDLTINTSFYSVLEVRDIIIEAFKQKFSK